MPWYIKGHRPWILLILLCAALYIPGLASLPAGDRDESRFMQASRQMMETGDLIRIRYMDEARNKKPAGIYWMQAASAALFGGPAGAPIWAYRIPSALGAVLAVVFTYLAGAALMDRRAAWTGAALFAVSILLIAEGHKLSEIAERLALSPKTACTSSVQR